MVNNNLVGAWPTPLKNMSQWGWDDIPYMKWKIKIMFQTTIQIDAGYPKNAGCFSLREIHGNPPPFGDDSPMKHVWTEATKMTVLRGTVCWTSCAKHDDLAKKFGFHKQTASGCHGKMSEGNAVVSYQRDRGGSKQAETGQPHHWTYILWERKHFWKRTGDFEPMVFQILVWTFNVSTFLGSLVWQTYTSPSSPITLIP